MASNLYLRMYLHGFAIFHWHSHQGQLQDRRSLGHRICLHRHLLIHYILRPNSSSDCVISLHLHLGTPIISSHSWTRMWWPLRFQICGLETPLEMFPSSFVFLDLRLTRVVHVCIHDAYSHHQHHIYSYSWSSYDRVSTYCDWSSGMDLWLPHRISSRLSAQITSK